MTYRWLPLSLLLLLPGVSGCEMLRSPSPVATAEMVLMEAQRTNEAIERGVAARGLAVREALADEDLQELDEWWRARDIYDPHKHLLPPMLAQLSLTPEEEQGPIWDVWLSLEEDKPELYHFRSLYDVRIFFLFQESLPEAVQDAYRSMLQPPRIVQWGQGGTENHLWQQYISGLAMMDGSGFPVANPHFLATHEAWLRAELTKYLTIGQGEFHSSTYYGFSIGALLNLYDFAQTPERRQLARAVLDWFSTQMALRLSWGTAGGAESRGFDRQTWGSGLTALAWIWWGEDDPQEIGRIVGQMGRQGHRLAILAATSGYRPPAQLRSLAQKTIPLPFQLRASHPSYYSYHQDNQFWETFYVTPDYSLGTLQVPGRNYQVEGTINAQYATYKLVVRDPQGRENAVVSLGGTYHSPLATGQSPGDRYLQEKGASLYQLRLTPEDEAAGVPGRSHLVIPKGYGEPHRIGPWYVWEIEGVWLCAWAWGDEIRLEMPLEEAEEHLALVAQGGHMAWVTEVLASSEYETLAEVEAALAQTRVHDENLQASGQLIYTSVEGDRLELIADARLRVGIRRINGVEQSLTDNPVLESPYVNQPLWSGRLTVDDPQLGSWELQLKPGQPRWSDPD
ncbi:hypothetical protein [Sodalinema gerasimenkoae]|uniref:hypothetical protein n=1 Tax=Sodalinema gerasimenkoae TaxID=2862348 RepID=UPI0013572251|nr:hypothetical protein [Sodalinema gerasimenkoae]